LCLICNHVNHYCKCTSPVIARTPFYSLEPSFSFPFDIAYFREEIFTSDHHPNFENGASLFFYPKNCVCFPAEEFGCIKGDEKICKLNDRLPFNFKFQTHNRVLIVFNIVCASSPSPRFLHSFRKAFSFSFPWHLLEDLRKLKPSLCFLFPSGGGGSTPAARRMEDEAGGWAVRDTHHHAAWARASLEAEAPPRGGGGVLESWARLATAHLQPELRSAPALVFFCNLLLQFFSSYSNEFVNEPFRPPPNFLTQSPRNPPLSFLSVSVSIEDLPSHRVFTTLNQDYSLSSPFRGLTRKAISGLDLRILCGGGRPSERLWVNPLNKFAGA